MSAVSVVIIMHAAIVHHGRDVGVVVLRWCKQIPWWYKSRTGWI